MFPALFPDRLFSKLSSTHPAGPLCQTSASLVSQFIRSPTMGRYMGGLQVTGKLFAITDTALWSLSPHFRESTNDSLGHPSYDTGNSQFGSFAIAGLGGILSVLLRSPLGWTAAPALPFAAPELGPWCGNQLTYSPQQVHGLQRPSVVHPLWVANFQCSLWKRHLLQVQLL